MSLIKKLLTFKLILILEFLLLASILYFDFRVYKTFVLDIEARSKKYGAEQLFLLKTPLLEKAALEITKKDEFITNPRYPLIKDPF